MDGNETIDYSGMAWNSLYVRPDGIWWAGTSVHGTQSVFIDALVVRAGDRLIRCQRKTTVGLGDKAWCSWWLSGPEHEWNDKLRWPQADGTSPGQQKGWEFFPSIRTVVAGQSRVRGATILPAPWQGDRPVMCLMDARHNGLQCSYQTMLTEVALPHCLPPWVMSVQLTSHHKVLSALSV